MKWVILNSKLTRMFFCGILAMIFGSAVAFSVAWAAGEGECCNQKDWDSCSGCLGGGHPTGIYVLLPSNAVYQCQDYVNPLSCDDSDYRVCYTFLHPVNTYYDNQCTQVGGTLGGGTYSVLSCEYDSCD